MAYAAEVTRRAQQRLAQQKADHESRQNQRRFESYEKVPRLREIDVLLRRSMTLAAQSVFLKGQDAVTAMEQAKNANLALQQERKALVQANFPAGWLDEEPICSHCGGSGYVGAVMCSCLQELCRQEQKKELSLLTGGQERFDAFRLDYYPSQVDPDYGASPRQIMSKTLHACHKYAQEFSLNAGNLLFVGNTGLGKTFLSACIANEVADKGFSVTYESAPRLFEKLNKNQFSPDDQSRENAARISQCDLLILDDLGTELTTNFTVAALYSLISDRLQSGKPTIISTNLNANEVAQRYSPQIASRLMGSFRGLTFVGQDIRVMKNRRM